MNLIYLVKLYFIAMIAFLGLDLVWLTKVAPSFYKNNIGHLMADKPNLGVAGLFYLFNIIGILIFAVVPSLKENSIIKSIIYGALYGFFTYATYDLTNFATLKDWPLTVVIVDIIWGSLLSATVSLITYYIGKKIS